MSRPARAAAAVAALTLAAPPALAVSVSPRASTAAARLEGQFLMAGRITVARNVRGERAGQSVVRAWRFIPACGSGPCANVGLVRERSGGTDRLVLRQRSPRYYVGKGTFYAPLRCGNQTYTRGQRVPFTIGVRVTATSLSAGALVATGIVATYTNRSRTNLTPCVAFLGHDAATYLGQLVPSSGGAGAGA